MTGLSGKVLTLDNIQLYCWIIGIKLKILHDRCTVWLINCFNVMFHSGFLPQDRFPFIMYMHCQTTIGKWLKLIDIIIQCIEHTGQMYILQLFLCGNIHLVPLLGTTMCNHHRTVFCHTWSGIILSLQQSHYIRLQTFTFLMYNQCYRHSWFHL